MKGFIIIKFISGKGIMYKVESISEYHKIIDVANKKFGNKIIELKFMKNVITTNRINSKLLNKMKNSVVIIKGNEGYVKDQEIKKFKLIEGDLNDSHD